MTPVPASFLCPTCHSPLHVPDSGIGSILCDTCRSEVDVARLQTLVGRPRFVAERCWTGTELDGGELGGLVVGERIGSGGMGTVYRATNATGELFAVKFLSPSLAAEPELVERFSREIDLHEKLDHPAIVRVRAHGVELGAQGEIPWFAMDLVEGPTLAERLSEGVLSKSEAIATFSRLLLALAHAHSRGIIHRDLKPTNVLLAKDGPRLVDFGIAHLEGTASTLRTQLTRTDAILGTFPYMSPEQRAGKRVDARSDLFSLGIMLYEALTGERPEGAFRPIHEFRREIPARVDSLVAELLKPNPAERLPSALVAQTRFSAAFAHWSPKALVPYVVAVGSAVLVIAVVVGMQGAVNAGSSGTPVMKLGDTRRAADVVFPPTAVSAPLPLPILLGVRTAEPATTESERVLAARAAKTELGAANANKAAVAKQAPTGSSPGSQGDTQAATRNNAPYPSEGALKTKSVPPPMKQAPKRPVKPAAKSNSYPFPDEGK